MLRCYVQSTALYGSETWILRELERMNLESFEMWCWRRMDKIKYSEEVIGEKRTLINNIQRRRTNWIGP